MKLTDPLATYTYYYSSPPVTVGEPVMVFFFGGGADRYWSVRPWVRLPKWSDLLQVQTTVFQLMSGYACCAPRCRFSCYYCFVIFIPVMLRQRWWRRCCWLGCTANVRRNNRRSQWSTTDIDLPVGLYACLLRVRDDRQEANAEDNTWIVSLNAKIHCVTCVAYNKCRWPASMNFLHTADISTVLM